VGPTASLYVRKIEDSLALNSGPSIPLPSHSTDYTILFQTVLKEVEVLQILDIHCKVSGVKGMAWLLYDF
jgi:hypothetical protein